MHRKNFYKALTDEPLCGTLVLAEKGKLPPYCMAGSSCCLAGVVTQGRKAVRPPSCVAERQVAKADVTQVLVCLGFFLKLGKSARHNQ